MPRFLDTQNLDVERLGCTVPEAELVNFVV